MLDVNVFSSSSSISIQKEKPNLWGKISIFVDNTGNMIYQCNFWGNNTFFKHFGF